MAQIRTFVREDVLEKLFAGEILEIWIADPALAHRLVGQVVDVLEQEQSDDKPCLDPGSSFLAVERRDLAIDPDPINAPGELHQFVLHIDDLIEPGPEKIARSGALELLR